MNQPLFTTDAAGGLTSAIADAGSPRLCVLADTNTARLCLPQLPVLEGAYVITVPAGESHKDFNALQQVWHAMHTAGLNRSDMLVNVGGGMITDLGGFAAATYMRGIRYINVPTTLLAAVDASSGGKTAIDFDGVKNLVGAFHAPESTVISAQFLHSLPRREILSGLGEMLKHALLDTPGHLQRLLAADLSACDATELLQLIRMSAEVKRRIVDSDPWEKGLRRMLNLGHTAGHALESFCLRRGDTITHGHAVALGLLAELRLSPDFDKDIFNTLALYIRSHYPAVSIPADSLAEIESYMLSDKKNTGHSDGDRSVSFIMLRAIGDADIYATADAHTIARQLSCGCVNI